MFATRITELFGIDHPLIQAPMNWATSAELVAAVSDAGGLGTLGPNASVSLPSRDVDEMGERLRAEIRRIRELTDRPFAVNIPIGRGHTRVYSDRTVHIVIEERVPIAITATGGPNVYTSILKDAGVVVVHAISSVYHAKKAEACGVDAVVAEGYDAGGHTGFDEIPTMALVPQVVDAVAIPVIAAGGISDARGLLAALCLGAEGVYMGTRFLASEECPIHDRVKEALVQATDNSTVSWGKTIGVARTLRNDFTKKFIEMERSGATPDELSRFIEEYYPFGPNTSRRQGGLKHGDLAEGEIYCGAGVGLVKEILPARDIVQSVMRDARSLLEHRIAKFIV